MNQCWLDARVRFLEPFDKNEPIQVWLGKRFIFADLDAVEDISNCQWINGLEEHLIGRKAIVSLDKSGTYSLNKIKVTPAPIGELKLASISSDRRIYRSDQDKIHLFIAAPRQKLSSLNVWLFESGRVYDEYSIKLDEFGLGQVAIAELPAGNYTAAIDEASDGKWRRTNDVNCEFSVCDYKLVPLVANLKSFSIDEHPAKDHQEILLATVFISRLGEPFTGKARFDVYGGKECLGSQTLNVTDGEAGIKFPFRSEEELSLQIQLEQQPDLTATVNIPSSTHSDRRQQRISTIGTVVQGSLAPTGNSTNVRGIFLNEHGINNQPVHMVSHGDGKIVFESCSSVENLVVQCIPISTNGLESNGCSKQFGNLPIAHSVSLTTKAAVNLVGAACFVDGEPWEAWGFVIANSDSFLEIVTPRESDTDNPNRLTVRSNGSRKAYVVVRDSRIAAGQSTESKFAGQILDYVQNQFSSYVIETPRHVADIQPITMKLVRDGLISLEQLHDAENFARQTSGKVSDAVLRLGYVSNSELCKAWADLLDFSFVDIQAIDIHEDVIELMPESIAREYNVFPIAYSSGEMIIATHDPTNVETIDKLGFILNCKISVRVSTREKIVSAIDRFYGQIEGETADSILQEFCDTACDFTDTTEIQNRKPPSNLQSSPDQDFKDECSTVFAGLVKFEMGKAEIDLPDLQANREYEVSVFAVSGMAGFDWVEATSRFTFNRFPYAEFCLPSQMHASDGAQGKLMFATKSRQARVTINVPGGKTISQVVDSNNLIDQITFFAIQGEYSATVEDLNNDNESVTVKHLIQNPESSTTYSRRIRILQPGESFQTQNSSTINNITLANRIQNPIKDMASSICNYQHCCCEQTAAKIRSATYLYLLSDPESEERFFASKSIVQGVNRLREMQLAPGQFSIYPNTRSAAGDFWNLLVCQHLRFLSLLSNRNIECRELKSAIQCGIDISDSRIHSAANTALDHYLTFRFSKNDQRRISSLNSLVSLFNDPTKPTTAVQARTENAYIAAAFLCSGKPVLRNKGLQLTNQILQAMTSEGRLYSTLDSTAALTMLTELKSIGCNPSGKVRINGQLCEKSSAQFENCDLLDIEAVGEPVVIRYQERKQIAWGDFKNNVPINVSTTKNGNHMSSFKLGEKLNLQISLQHGYKFGDHALIYLPDSIAYLSFGGQVKQLNVDFVGESQISIPLAVTSTSKNGRGEQAPHHFAVYVRNMYDEERIGSSGWLKINCLN